MFCDKKLIAVDDTTYLSESFKLQDNPGFIKRQQDIRPSVGLVIFNSSGSTGVPKYIGFHSDKLIQNAINCVEHFKWNDKMRLLIPVPVHHMYGLGVGLLPALLSGADFLLINKNNILKLYEQLDQYHPDVTLVTPAICKMMLLLDKRMTHKSMFITAGEPINHKVYEEFENKQGLLINLYGCTELGAIATSSLKRKAKDRWEGIVEPMTGVKIKIDASEKGELLCDHNAGFDGYLDHTGVALKSVHKKEQWFRTRDFGAMVDENGFKVLGRVDHCTNRLGFLVSIPEIETKLEGLTDGISQVAVFEKEKQTLMGRILVAIFEMKEHTELNIGHIRSLCKAQLPKHFVPDEFYVTDTLPRLDNGKIDRFSLKCYYSDLINQ